MAAVGSHFSPGVLDRWILLIASLEVGCPQMLEPEETSELGKPSSPRLS